MSTGTDMGTAGPVIKVGATSRGGGRPSGSSVRLSVAVPSGVAPSVADAAGAVAGEGRAAVTYVRRSWRC